MENEQPNPPPPLPPSEPPAPPPSPAPPAAPDPEEVLRASALEFALALTREDDFPENQIQAVGAAVVAVAPDEVELDRLVAAILLTPARARFRAVPVLRALDPKLVVEFERESPAVIAAREKLWRILRQLDDEIAQADSASRYMPKELPGKRPTADFLANIQRVRQQIARYHGQCYGNSLMDSHERITATVIRRAVHVARSAGIRVSIQE